MIGIKVNFKDEVRRVQVHTNQPHSFTYENLLETARNLFPVLRSATNVKFTWLDDENDLISCSSDSEVAIAIDVMHRQLGGVCKFTASAEEKIDVPNDSKNKEVHSSVTCDGCGMSPLVGTRYKCSVRENFDLCESCEAKDVQPHPMIKIYAPEQAPLGIFVAIPEHSGHPHHRPSHMPPCGGPPPHMDPIGAFGRRHGPNIGPFGGCHNRPDWKGNGGHCHRRGGGGGGWRGAGSNNPNKFEHLSKEFMGYWRKPTAEGGPPEAWKKCAGPWVEVVDALGKAFVSPDGSYASATVDMNKMDTTTTKSNTKETATTESGTAKTTTTTDFNGDITLEDQLLDEILQLSLQEQMNTNTTTSDSTSSTPSTSTSTNSTTSNTAFPTQTTATLPESHSLSMPRDANTQPVQGYPEAQVILDSVNQLINSATDGLFSPPPLLSDSKYNPNNSYFSKFTPPTYAATTTPTTIKPMARFVTDITLPDGSNVLMGTKVIKTWKVRNDGEQTWPEGVNLTFSSGDLLASSTNDFIIPVKALAPGEEIDISVPLQIPETTGRHVTYFRLRTREGNIFGQRLWADVRVIDSDSGWVGVTNGQNSAILSPSTPPITTSGLSTTTTTTTSSMNVDATPVINPSIQVPIQNSTTTTNTTSIDTSANTTPMANRRLLPAEESKSEEVPATTTTTTHDSMMNRNTIPMDTYHTTLTTNESVDYNRSYGRHNEFLSEPMTLATNPNTTVTPPMPETTTATTTTTTTTTMSNNTNTAVASNAAEVWSPVWSRELQILADMGFTDTATLIPLLMQHVGVPVSLCPELNGIPNAEGMQRLLTALLSRSGISNP